MNLEKEALRLYKKTISKGKFYDEDLKDAFNSFQKKSRSEQINTLKRLKCLAGENEAFDKTVDNEINILIKNNQFKIK